jgi:hypothetical protein
MHLDTSWIDSVVTEMRCSSHGGAGKTFFTYPSYKEVIAKF